MPVSQIITLFQVYGDLCTNLTHPTARKFLLDAASRILVKS